MSKNGKLKLTDFAVEKGLKTKVTDIPPKLLSEISEHYKKVGPTIAAAWLREVHGINVRANSLSCWKYSGLI